MLLVSPRIFWLDVVVEKYTLILHRPPRSGPSYTRQSAARSVGGGSSVDGGGGAAASAALASAAFSESYTRVVYPEVSKASTSSLPSTKTAMKVLRSISRCFSRPRRRWTLDTDISFGLHSFKKSRHSYLVSEPLPSPSITSKRALIFLSSSGSTGASKKTTGAGAGAGSFFATLTFLALGFLADAKRERYVIIDFSSAPPATWLAVTRRPMLSFSSATAIAFSRLAIDSACPVGRSAAFLICSPSLKSAAMALARADRALPSRQSSVRFVIIISGILDWIHLRRATLAPSALASNLPKLDPLSTWKL
mmetsp:Transcript_20983/g.54620  ORF Transcript_20983/g.54620 Transcript_20983/m.54620 type:complete len:308 (-) Transcript_20983:454-1377(-)